MTLADAMLHAVAPAAAGVALALLLLFRAGRDVPADLRGRLLVYASLPVTALLLAFVGAMQAAPLDVATVRAPLLALGAAAFVQATAQGVLAARAVPSLAAEPEAFGRTLIPLAVPEVLTVGALLWVLTAAAPPT